MVTAVVTHQMPEKWPDCGSGLCSRTSSYNRTRRYHSKESMEITKVSVSKSWPNSVWHLRRNDRDQYAGERSFMYGKSVHNQRIESMWGNVRRQGIQYWINIFQELAEEGMHDGSYLEQELTRF